MKVGSKITFFSQKIGKDIEGTITHLNKRTALIRVLNKEYIEKPIEGEEGGTEKVAIDVPKIIKRTFNSFQVVE